MSKQIESNLIAVNEREIEEFERAVYNRRHEQAGTALIALLPRLNGVFGAPGYLAAAEVERYLYTRLGAALTAFLADEALNLSQAGFDALVLRQPVIPMVFEASAFEGSDHLVRLIGTRDPANPDRINFPTPQQQLKLLLAYSLDSDIELDLEAMLRRDPGALFPAFLGMLGRCIVLTRNAHRRRSQLLRLGGLFENVAPRIDQMPALASIWMNCMYGTEPDRHAIRRPLNTIARRVAAPAPEHERAPGTPRRALAERPVMLAPLEHFRVPHVNYLWFAPVLRKLRERFLLVGAGTAQDLDEVSRNAFDRLIEFDPPDTRGFRPLLDALSAVKADIVLYPTLGIQWWWVAVCNVRLAPIQAMLMGVPASSFSGAMDYVVIDESWAGEPDCYSETLVHVRAGATRFQPRGARVPPPPPAARNGGSPVRVAVPALVTKLNAPFLEACREIAKKSRAKLEWHFFPGMSGLHHRIATRGILEWFPEARVYGYMEYDAYLEALARCDVHLSPFPFGGSSSNMDSMQLGIPIVTLEGREAHSQTDAGMLRRAGLPSWLIAHDAEQYVRAALRLIDSPGELAKTRRQFLAVRIDEIFTEADPAAADDYANAFCWLYEHHQHIQSTGRRCWTVADRAGVSPTPQEALPGIPAATTATRTRKPSRERRARSKPDRVRRARD
ncbi:MAG: hypothetical protein AB1452_10895 [Pseudomonadota bacterium]